MQYLKPLIQKFEEAADKIRAEKMSAYMKNKFPFYGIDAKTRIEIQKNFFKKHGWPEREKLFEVVFNLWDIPERECQACAIGILQKFQESLSADDIVHLEKLIVTKSWWDSVDGLSAWICGAYFTNYREKLLYFAEKWVESNNFWLQRASLLIQLKYKENTNTELLQFLISKLHREKEFFIRKAIGWVLREYSKTNSDWVRGLIHEIPLSPLSLKEGSKYL